MVQRLRSAEACVEQAIERVGSDIRLGASLALGKPPQLMNAFYRRAESDPAISLHIFTALTLERPRPGSALEASLAAPIIERLFGDYEEPLYMQALRDNTLPANITVSEFYFKAGAMKNVPSAQQNYISSNYTHVARDLANAGVNVLTAQVASRELEGELQISLSATADTAGDLLQLMRARQGDACIAIGQSHADLPFMEHDAIVGPDDFDLLLDDRCYDRRLFAVPNAAVPLQDYATGLHASSLIRDGGTLQIGIGCLGDAVAQACILRHRHNTEYRNMLNALTRDAQPDPLLVEQCEPFSQGLYASTEMFVNGMMHLIEAGVIKRRVYDNLILQRGLNAGEISTLVDQQLLTYSCDKGLLPRVLDAQALALGQYWGILPQDLKLSPTGLQLHELSLPNALDHPAVHAAILGETGGHRLRHGRYLHGGFFLGPQDFYAKLRALDADGREAIAMTSISRTNQLLQNPTLYTEQRRDARFINTGMVVSLSGAVASDGLEDGTVVSGVGGQYNFVAMAHDLPDARSVLCIRSTRGSGEQLQSNIVPFYGHTTIPRHLRDVVVTEYGIADLRGQGDAEVIKRLLAIADSRFQQELLQFARDHGKIESSYEIPPQQRNNTPQQLAAALQPFQRSGALPDFPFGTDLTEQEVALAATLREIRDLTREPGHFIATAFRALWHRADEAAAQPWLERIQLEHPDTPREFLVQQLLLLELEEKGLLKVS